jgi:hypothetical protein
MRLLAIIQCCLFLTGCFGGEETVKSEEPSLSSKERGALLWADTRLSRSGVLSCLSAGCHKAGLLLNLDKNLGDFPHYVAMAERKIDLKGMINVCMTNPMRSKAFPLDSADLQAIADYFPEVVKIYRGETGQ